LKGVGTVTHTLAMSIRFTIIRRRRITTEADVDASQRG
jgi:hypothetical protein